MLKAAFQTYLRWTTRGPKWHLIVGLLVPFAILAIAAAGDDETRQWLFGCPPQLPEVTIDPNLDEAWEEESVPV